MRTILVFLSILVSTQLFAQNQNDSLPVQWSFNIVSKAKGLYVIQAKATIQKDYHIWALDAGGDGSLIPTSIDIIDESFIDWKGDWLSNTQPLSKTYDFIDGAVYYYENSVVFYRTFTINKNVDVSNEIKGSLTYQTCTHDMCLPPTDVSFNVKIKE